jgi:hypothetical protein
MHKKTKFAQRKTAWEIKSIGKIIIFDLHHRGIGDLNSCAKE